MEEAGGSGIEMEERPSRGLSRQPSLDSQRQRRASPGILRRFTGKFSLPWILRWLPGESSVAPQPSQPVNDVIKRGANIYRSDAYSFMRDFHHISHRPISRVQDIFEIFIRSQHMGTESEETTGTHYYHVGPALAIDRS